MAKMSQKMMTLCSAAIGAVYIAGYFVTEPSDQTLAQGQYQQSNVNPSAVAAPKVSIDQNKNISIQAPKKNTQQVSKVYKDGIFNGEGFNRIGAVGVAVTIKNDHITNVEITSCSTSYPQSYIKNLPNQVIVRQSPKVDVVSGATRSTEDFQTAVEQALQQAKI